MHIDEQNKVTLRPFYSHTNLPFMHYTAAIQTHLTGFCATKNSPARLVVFCLHIFPSTFNKISHSGSSRFGVGLTTVDQPSQIWTSVPSRDELARSDWSAMLSDRVCLPDDTTDVLVDPTLGLLLGYHRHFHSSSNTAGMDCSDFAGTCRPIIYHQPRLDDPV